VLSMLLREPSKAFENPRCVCVSVCVRVAIVCALTQAQAGVSQKSSVCLSVCVRVAYVCALTQAQASVSQKSCIQ
jgi:hypothetical protein